MKFVKALIRLELYLLRIFSQEDLLGVEHFVLTLDMLELVNQVEESR